jgi:hypothetical protein
MPFLFADLDFKDQDLQPEEIERILRNLDCPPTLMVHSGHGIHCYWVLDAAVKLPDGMDRAEELLRRLADHLGGDKQVAHVAALLRLPGTHNTKRGECHKVRLIKEGRERYSLDQMTQWLDAQTKPALVRRGKPTENNPFLKIYQEMGFKAPVNVTERLQAMRVGGEGDSGVHQTQLSVTGSLVAAGVPEDEIVSRVLVRTQELEGTQDWNWRVEERTLRTMIRDMKRKIDAHSASDIARELGCSRSAICAKVQRLGLKRSPNHTGRQVRRRPVESAPRPPLTTRKSLERVNYNKRELQEMLAKAVRNTG